MDSFQSQFNDAVWIDGALYYKQGKVTRYEQTDTFCSAVVNDGNPYAVKIYLNQNEMECSCPDAKAGIKCRHMAAVLCARIDYASKQDETLPKKKNQQKNIEACFWYPRIKHFLTPKQKIKDSHLFASAIDTVLEMTIGELNISLDVYAQDCFTLLLFMEKNSDNWRVYQTISDCVIKFAQLRFRLNETNRISLDERVKKEIKHISTYDVVQDLLLYYFNNQNDIPFLQTLLSKYPIEVVDDLIQNWLEQDGNEEQKKAMCLAFSEHKLACHWLAAYYLDTKQYEAGIQLLNTYCVNHESSDLGFEHLYLMQYYGCMHHYKEQNHMLQQLLNNRHMNKVLIFQNYKKSMSEEEWASKGRKKMLEWVDNKVPNTKYQLFKELREGSLLLAHFISQGYLLEELNECANILKETDEGALMSLYKQALIHEMEQNFSAGYALSTLKYNMPEWLYYSDAMKYMILELEERYQDRSYVLERLENMEDDLYGYHR